MLAILLKYSIDIKELEGMLKNEKAQ